MDEQRLQAYFQFIDKLLSCPEEKKINILQAHEDLVDAGLVSVISLIADQMMTESPKGASWFRKLARQTKQSLMLRLSNASISEDVDNFMYEIMTQIAKNQGDSEKIYEFLQGNLHRFNQGFLDALPVIFRRSIEQNNLESTAFVFTKLGNLMAQFPFGILRLKSEIAISAYEQVLQIRPRDKFLHDWVTIQNNLANVYRDRIQGDPADNLEQAILTYKRVLEVCTRKFSPEQWAMTQNNLANAYGDRIRGEPVENLEQAIAAYQCALKVYTREEFPQDWAMVQSNLATVYRERIQGDPEENLERAIAACQCALEVYSQGDFPEQRIIVQNNLAAAYSDRIRGEKADNMEIALTICKRALEERFFLEKWATTQHNLAVVYRDRIRGDWPNNRKQAIKACERALKIRTRETFPNKCRKTSRLLGNLQSELQNWDAATQAYGQALAAAEDLYQACTLLDSQAGELKETADLPRRAAYAYAKAGQLNKALKTIERGRARGLSETLRRDRADLAQLQQQRPDLFDRYRDITNQLQNLESQQRDQQIRDRQALTPEQHRTEAQQLRQELTDAIAQIRQVPGHETFLQAPSLEEIQQNLSTESPTVYLIPAPNGSLALIAEPHAIGAKSPLLAPLWLDGFPDTTLIDLVQTWFNAYRNLGTDFSGWLDAIAQGTRQLWDNLMAPLIDWLKQHNHTQAILIPTGLFGLLPLHAAWTDDPTRPTGRRYALDDILFTYAPNAQSLVAARAIAQQFPDSHLDSILAIDNPRQDLPSSELEVMAAVSTFPRPTILRHQTATTEAVKTALADAAIVHFSCHGTADFNEPLNSGLLMSDDRLTLRDLFALKLTEGNKPGIRLAVLSACETGLPGLELADEAIGLPVGMMQAGVAAVVASLWSVSDLSTSLLLRKFYDLWRNQNLAPSEALRQAQIWLRDSTNSEISAEFDDYQDYLDDDQHDYAHPFHWSAFGYLGI